MKNLFPEIIEYQPYSICNANCNYCPVGALNRQDKLKGHDISDKVFNELVEQTRGHKITRISPHFNCEPLLSNTLPHQIKTWKNVHPASSVDLSTNCVFLTEEMALELNDAGLDVLELHYMGVKKDFHELAMKTNYEKVTANIEKIVALKNKNRLKMQIYIFAHRMNGASLNEWHEFSNKWKKKGAEVVLGPLWNRAGYYGKDFIKKKKGVILSRNPYPCNKPWNQLAVQSDGEVRICSLDYFNEVKIGNILENKIEKIWNNEVMKRYQNGQNKLSELKKLHLCNKCIRGGDYFLTQNKLTKLINKKNENKIGNFFYKMYLGLLDHI